MVSRVSDHHSQAEEGGELVGEPGHAKDGNLNGKEPLRPFESVERGSPERDARDGGPAEQNRGEGCGQPRQKPLLLSAVVDGQERSDQTEQSAGKQEEGYDLRAKWRVRGLLFVVFMTIQFSLRLPIQ